MRSIRFFLLALVSVVLTSCVISTSPDDDPGATPSDVTFAPVPDLPRSGGNVTHVGVMPGGVTVLLIDGRLHTMATATSDPQPAGPTATYLTMGTAPTNEIYGVTSTEIHVYDQLSSAPRVIPIDPAGPLSTNGRVEAADVVFGRTGDVYVTMTSNYPRFYIYQTTDRGVTWREIATPSSQFTTALTVAPNGSLHVASSQAYYISTNGGANWQSKPTPVQNYAGTMRVMSDGSIYYWLPQAGALHVSRDGGNSFTSLSDFNRPPFFIDVREASGGVLYALASDGAQLTALQPSRFMKSTDGGATWSTMLYCNGRAMSIHNNTIVVGLGGEDNRYGGVYVTRNDGATWSSTGVREASVVNDIAIDGSGSLVAIIDNALYRRTESRWNLLGSQGGNFSRVAASGASITVVSSHTVYSTPDYGITWRQHAITDYIGGRGSFVVPALIALRGGGFLMSLTSYENPGNGYHAGVLYRIGSDGKPTRVTGATGTFMSLVEDRNGKVYGGEQYLDGISQTYTSVLHESPDGLQWSIAPQGVRAGQSYNSANRYVRAGSNNSLVLGTTRGTEDKERTVKGYAVPLNQVRKLMFDHEDRLYLVPTSGGLFVSTEAVR